MNAPVMDRLMSRVVYSDTFFAGTPCWIYAAGRTWAGYGLLRIDGRLDYTHRVTYSAMVAPIPSGYQIDHLCRTRSCCNPAHLEAVTPKMNVWRSTSPAAANAKKGHRQQGHPLAGDNLYVRPTGKRDCRACKRQRDREYLERKRTQTTGNTAGEHNPAQPNERNTA